MCNTASELCRHQHHHRHTCASPGPGGHLQLQRRQRPDSSHHGVDHGRHLQRLRPDRVHHLGRNPTAYTYSDVTSDERTKVSTANK
jgi:hypothetical protein